MKRIFLLFLLLSTTMLVMCTETVDRIDDSEREAEIVASVENYMTESGSASSLSMKWHKKDQISVVSKAGHESSFKTSQKSANALFYGDIKGEPVAAFYPYSEHVRFNGDKVSFILPETQSFESGALAQNVNAAVALISDADNVVFKNVCGVLGLNLSMDGSSKSIGRIVLSDNSMPICGSFTVAMDAANPVAKYSKNGESEITLDCGEGVELGGTPQSFYFLLPEGSLEDGFDAKVYSTDGKLISSMSVEEDCTILRNNVTFFTPNPIKWLPSSYTELNGVEGNGSNYISTGLLPISGDRYEVCYTPKSVADGVVMGCESPDGSKYHIASVSSNTMVYSTFGSESVRPIQYQAGDALDQTVSVNGSNSTVQVVRTSPQGAVQKSSVMQFSSTVTPPSQILYLLASNKGGEAVDCFSGAVNSVIVTNRNVTRAYMIPCQRNSDGKKGMYDIVRDQFYPVERISGGTDSENVDPINLNVENDLTQEYWDYVLAHPYDESDYSYSYMKNYYKRDVSYKKDWPRSAAISWEPVPEATGQTITVARDEGFTDIYLTKTIANSVSSYELYNFVPGNTYWYKVSANFSGGDSENIIIGRINATGRRRVIRIDTQVFNVRDFGGLPVGNNKHLRYEQVYRGGRWNGNNTYITSEGKENLKQVGILSELDLRYASEAGNITTSAGGSQIEYKRFSESTNIFGQYYYEKCNNGDIFIQAMQYMIDKVRNHQPVYMHCSIGADRTGTLAVLMEGLLGVDYCNICMDWELTSFALVTAAPGDDLRSRYRPECSQNFNYEGMWNAIVNNHPGNTTQEKFYHYFNKGYTGDGSTGATISKEDLDWFIDYMTVDNE